MADSRLELLNLIQEQKKEFLDGLSDTAVKKFIRSNTKHFARSEDMNKLYRMLRDPQATVADIKAQMQWTGFGISEISARNMTELLYNPTESSAFKQFKDLLIENKGSATAVYVQGKRAVVMTNLSCYDVSYCAVKSMGGSVPDIYLIPWYQLTQTTNIVTEV